MSTRRSPHATPVASFPPLCNGSVSLLILGSMPGEASLAADQYYAHPRNAFWPLMTKIYDIDLSLPYAERASALLERGVAVWDVLKSCVRHGSLDSAIVAESVAVNDFPGLFDQCPGIRKIVFNGTTAWKTYKRHVLPYLESRHAALPVVQLPSTSPAHASLDFDAKLQLWRAGLIDSKPEAMAHSRI